MQRARLKALENKDSARVPSLVAGRNYITYFQKTWVPVAACWTVAGRVKAAALLGVSVDKIPTTNNHLEGFNHVLKASYLRTYGITLT